MANPIINSLPDYVEQHRLPLIAKSILGAKSAKLFTLQSGVKGTTALNLVSTDVQFGDGSECGWDAKGDTTLSQRTIEPAYLKVNHPFCDKNMLKKWTNYAVQIAAGAKTLPFEEDFTNGIVDGVDEAVETMIWQGEKSETSFDGILTIINALGEAVPSATGSQSAYEAIKNVYMKMKASVATKADAVIFVGDDTFRAYVQELVEANLYHFNPSDAEGEYKLPATNCRVISVNGLNGTNKIVGGRLSNFHYGTDMEGDEEKFDLWYSKDNREFRLAIEFVAGVQIAYPDEVVLGSVTE